MVNEQRRYTPEITTADLWPDVVNNIGSDKHTALIDQIAACKGPDDEELLFLMKQEGSNQEDVARTLGVSQQAISYRFRRIANEANKCRVRSTCLCHRRVG